MSSAICWRPAFSLGNGALLVARNARLDECGERQRQLSNCNFPLESLELQQNFTNYGLALPVYAGKSAEGR